jgi:hypothetical protein
METIDSNVHVPPSMKFQSSINRHAKRLHRESNTNLNTNARRRVDSEFDKLNAFFPSSLEAYYDPEGKNKHRSLPLYSENGLFLSHELVGQYVYRSPPWSLVVQCVEHLRMCHTKSPMNTKALILFYLNGFN